jgi:hypothetical protein
LRSKHPIRSVFARAYADHRFRHEPCGCEFVLAERIDQLRSDAWDALAARESVCLQRRFLRLLEQAGPPGLKMHYAIAYRDGEPLAAIACQSLAVRASALPSGKPRRGAAVRERGLRRIQQRVLICGNLLGWGAQGVAAAPHADPDSIWHAVGEALYRIRRQDVLFGNTGVVMVKDVLTEDAEAHAPLRRSSYAPIDTEPNMVLELRPEWGSFDHYLSALKSSYRSDIKKQIREVEEAGFTFEALDGDGVRRDADAIHALYGQVHEQQKLRLVTISPEWIPALAREFGDDFRTSVLRGNDGALVGFVTTLKDRDGAIAYYVGFDKRIAATGVPLYLRLLYRLIEDAIAIEARWVSLGRTALAPKAKLGAVGQPLRCYVRHRVPAMNALLRGLLQVVPDPDQPPERRPFKPDKGRE